MAIEPAACPAEFIAPLTAPEYRLPTSRQIAHEHGSIPSATPKEAIKIAATMSLPGIRAAVSKSKPETVRHATPIDIRPIRRPYFLQSRSLAQPPIRFPIAPAVKVRATETAI